MEIPDKAKLFGYTFLAYHIDLEWLFHAMCKVRVDGAVGVDKMTAAEYGHGERLMGLLDRFKTGTYKAPPVRRVCFPEKGTPQGGGNSPLLSNIFLNEVIDVWFYRDVKPRMKGRSFEIRYADDVLLGFEYREDAQRVLEVLSKRLAKYGLAMNMEKTKLVHFKTPGNKGQRETDTFDFLGFTHYWSRSRKNNWVVKRKTAKDRLNRALKKANEWLKENRHMKTNNQWTVLCKKLMGHYAYYGITFNMRAITQYYFRLIQLWFKWLNRRSRNKMMNWDKFKRKILANFQLPMPRIVHSYS